MSFCTAVNCMDGRTQLPVIRFLQERFGARYVDAVTEAGPNGVLARGEEREKIDSILRRCDISVEKHDSVGIAVVGHHDCAGNPADKATQLQQVEKAVKLLRERYPGREVIGLWLDENFEIHEVPV